MRTIALPILALGIASAAPPEPLPDEEMTEAQRNPPVPAQVDEAVCRDRIHEVREANGQPRLDRGTARPDEGQLIAAVDQRIDGCSVMVMRNDTSDVRPLPKPDGNVALIPAN